MSRQGADRALSWWCWNWLTGGRVGCGPTMNDESGRWTIIGHRALRAAPRWLPTAAAAGWVYSAASLPASWLWLAAVVLPVAAGVVAVVAVWVVCRCWHWWKWRRPLAHALAPAIGQETRTAWRWLRVPRQLHHGRERKLWKWHRPGGIVVHLGRGWQAKPKEVEQVQNIGRRKLAVPEGELSFTWQMRANWSYLQIRPKVLVPDAVMWTMPHVRQAMESTRSTVMLGLGPDERPTTLDLDSETPHVLFAGGTGCGKSVGIQSTVAKLIHDGATGIVLDIKRHSHPWLNDVPGVIYVRDLGDVHEMLLALQAEGDRRNRLWDNVGLDDRGPTFPRLVVLLEEIGQTVRQLKRYWASIKTSGEPPVSPAVDALAWLLMMGRAVRLHVVGAIQMGTAKDLGGTEIRENFGARLLSHYSRGGWKMLAGDIDYIPSVQWRGRFQVIKGVQAVETQLVYMTPHQARDYAREGAAAIGAGSDMAGVAALSHLGKDPTTVAGTTLLEAVPRLGGGIGASPMPLKAIAPTLDTTPAALQRAIQRGRERGAPAPVGREGQVDVYDPEQVGWWHRNRPRAGRGAE